MTTGTVGKFTTSVVVPLSNTTKRSKVLTLAAGTAPVITNSELTAWTTKIANFVFYRDSNSIWKMNFSFSGTCTAHAATITSTTFTIASVTTKNITGSKQACDVAVYKGADSISVSAYAPTNTSTVIVLFPGNATGQTEFVVSGDIELNAEPTVYTTVANMEKSTVPVAPPVASSNGSLVTIATQNFESNLTFDGSITADSLSADGIEVLKDLNLATIHGGDNCWQDGPTAGGDAYSSGVLLPSGKVLCIPVSYTNTKILYNPTTNLMENGPAGEVTDLSFVKSVLLPNGKVFCIPHTYSGTKNIYNPTTNLMENGPVGPASAGDSFKTGVLLPNGKVFCLPYMYSGTQVLYNSATNAWEDGPAGIGLADFKSCVLLPNGKVFCIASDYTGTKTIYNYSTNLMEDGPAGVDRDAFWCGVLLPNGKVFAISHAYSGTKVIYNPTTNLMEDGPASSDIGAFSGGVLLPNGKVFCVPCWYTGTKTVYNPTTNAWEDGPAGPGNNAFFGGVLLPNGKAFCIPQWYAGTKTLYNPEFTTNSAIPWCWHAAFNKS